jgi:hypothetical protein
LDLFGEETEEEKKASAEREAKKAASAKKKESMHCQLNYSQVNKLFDHVLLFNCSIK